VHAAWRRRLPLPGCEGGRPAQLTSFRVWWQGGGRWRNGHEKIFEDRRHRRACARRGHCGRNLLPVVERRQNRCRSDRGARLGDLRAATGTISGLSVANPEGFTDEAAIEFGDFNLGLDAGSLFSDPVVVQNIAVDDAVLRVEQRGARNNLQTLLDNLRSSTTGEPAEPDTGPGVVIQRFALSGAKVSLSAPGLDEQRAVELPDVLLTGIGQKSGGATGAELARELLEPVLREALQSSAVQGVKDRVREELDEKAGELADGLLERLGGERDDEKSGDEEKQ
jgi:hypothetical protein